MMTSVCSDEELFRRKHFNRRQGFDFESVFASILNMNLFASPKKTSPHPLRATHTRVATAFLKRKHFSDAILQNCKVNITSRVISRL